jgi:4-hydroxybenzoate polyprenyltransferase
MASSPSTNQISLLQALKYVLEAVKMEQSLFALPFAYIGMLLAEQSFPGISTFFWITMGMIGARNAGMALNRVIDREMDAKNPRTQSRHLPQGLLTTRPLLILAAIGIIITFLSASMLNTTALLLSPIAILAIIGYSYIKRISWMTHFFLGCTLSIAPAGGWIAVTGNLPVEGILLTAIVATFASGFDIFNTISDAKFDKANGVYSIPARFGVPTALWVSRGLHCLTSIGLLVLGILMTLSWPYYLAWITASLILIWEHRLLANDLGNIMKVFSTLNALVSMIMLIGTILALVTP